MSNFINRNERPLSMEQIGQRAPSALATRPFDAMSARYTYVPTLGVIQAMIAAGFQPFSATQSRTRIVGKGDFTKHMLRFRRSDVGPLVVGDVVPEVVLINSHDGTSAYKLMSGLYRLICSNGLMVSDRELDAINITHKGDIVGEVIEGSRRLIAETQKSLGTVRNWTQLQLTSGEQSAFAEAAHTLRFADSEGITTTPITADQLLTPRRREDVGSDLWRTLNRVQENVIVGGLSAIQRDAEGRRVRRVSTRRINGIDQDVRLNKALWELASRMAELKAGVPFIEGETVVWEDPANKNYETDYAYDTLNNMTSATQKGDNSGNRTRTFSYDSLSRLLSATNPESGAISYTYSNSPSGACASSPDIVCTKTAPAANQTGTATATTAYTYDALDRLTGKTYAGVTTPSVYYGYDHDTSTLSSCGTSPPSLADSYPISERTAMCDGSGATSWSHNQMGLVLTEKRTLGTHTNMMSYTYHLDNSLLTMQYPNTGKTITYTLNSSGGYTAGRFLTAKDVSGAINYVTGATYAPQGALASLTNGGVIFGAFSYNSRLQPLQIFYGTNTPPSLTGSTCPGTVGNIMHRLYNFGLGTNDNGNVASIANCRDTTRSQNFTYDTLNRLANGYTTSSTWGETYTIDPWSNLTNIAKYTGKTNSETLNCSTANTKNQLNTCYSYDAAGNLTQSGSTTYTYDAENRLTALSSPGWYYVYDGDGNRVEKCTASPCPTTGTGTIYWRDLAGDTISETQLNGTITSEYIFFDGKRVARRDITGNVVNYYFADHLGTQAVVENATGTQCEQDMDYYPYGGVENDYCTTPVAQNYKFNGKERDSESGLDEFGARYYGSSFGRFMTPDWAAKAIAVPYANFGNPQSLNLYSYVENNPTTMGDPDGHGGPAIEPANHGAPGTGDSNPLCYNNPDNCHSGSQSAQNKSWWQKALSYFYVKTGNGKGFGVKDFKLGPVKVDAIERSDGKDVKQTTAGKTVTTVNSQVGVKVDIGPVKLGVERTNSQEDGQAPKTEWVPGFEMGKFEGSGSEIGVGAGGCFVLCGQVEVGVQGDKVWGDVKSYVTDPGPPPAPPTPGPPQ